MFVWLLNISYCKTQSLKIACYVIPLQLTVNFQAHTIESMKRYLVIFLFILSFIANSNVLASVWFGSNKSADTVQVMSSAQHATLQMTKMSNHCHQLKAYKTLTPSDDDMQLSEFCDNCFTHCGGALLSAAFPNFVAPPSFWVSVQTAYYTPLLTSSFLRPPQVSWSLQVSSTGFSCCAELITWWFLSALAF